MRHHGHEHDHHQAPAAFTTAFAAGVGLNALFVLVEAAAGFWTGSLALLADAGHNLSDVLGLVLAWGATYLSRRRPSGRQTYGLGRTSILAALANGVLLLIAVGAITWEAISRLRHPTSLPAGMVIIVAGFGAVINTLTALLFFSGRQRDLNVRGAFLHMAADAAVSIGVVIGAVAMIQTGWLWIDPVLGLIIAAAIAYSTWDLLWQALELTLDIVPRGIDPAKVRAYLAELPGVTAIHDLHIWALSTTETALTVHLIRPGATIDDDWLHEVTHELLHRFGIRHATIQIESGHGNQNCRLAPDDVV
jgi:cobalt-zinc-cadmium efflux system protein